MNGYLKPSHQCMSISLLNNPKKPYELLDVLESILWAMVYLGLHHVSHPDRDFLVNFDPFGPGRERIVDGTITASNAAGKRALLGSGALRTFPFVSSGYRKLLGDLLKPFHTYHALGELTGHGKEEYEDTCRKLSNPDWWIETLQRALDTGAWVDDDIVDDIFPPLSTNLQRRQLDTAASSLFDTTHIDGTTGRPHTSMTMSLDPPQVNPSMPQLFSASNLSEQRNVGRSSQQVDHPPQQVSAERKDAMRKVKRRPKREEDKPSLDANPESDPPVTKKPRIV